MSKIKFTNIIYQEDGKFLIYNLNLHIATFGNSKKHAIEMMDDAINLYLQEDPKAEILEVTNPEIVIQE